MAQQRAQPANRAHFSAEIEASTIRRLHQTLADSVGICDVPPAGLEPALKRF